MPEPIQTLPQSQSGGPQCCGDLNIERVTHHLEGVLVDERRDVSRAFAHNLFYKRTNDRVHL